jgi:hypothetical protein
VKLPLFKSLPLGETKKLAAGDGEIVIVADAEALAWSPDVAVTVTVFPEGTDAGAV